MRRTITIHDETWRRLIKAKGGMELKNGKRRSFNDVISELIDHFEGKK